MKLLSWILEWGREYVEPASLRNLCNTRLIKFGRLILVQSVDKGLLTMKWYLEPVRMKWLRNEMVFRICTYEMISGFHMVYDGVQFLRSFRILDTTLLKNELLCRYFSIIYSRDLEQTFCRKPSSIYFWRFFLNCLLKDTHVNFFFFFFFESLFLRFSHPWNNVNSIRPSTTAEIMSHDWWFLNQSFETF